VSDCGDINRECNFNEERRCGASHAEFRRIINLRKLVPLIENEIVWSTNFGVRKISFQKQRTFPITLPVSEFISVFINAYAMLLESRNSE